MQLTVSNLPNQQAQALYHAALGHCVKTTARAMGVEPRTVKAHRARVIDKLGAKRMNGAIAEAFKRGHLKYIPILLVCLCSIFGGDHQSRTVKVQRPQIVRVRESFV